MATRIKLLLLSLALLVAGCRAFGPEVVPTGTATRTPVPFTPQVGSPAPDPSETPRPVGPGCRPDIVPVELATADYGAYPQAILAYLNAGGSPVTLSGLLNAREVAGQPVSVVIADFTGDGRDDVAVALADPRGDDLNARLVIYTCRLADYETALNQPAGSDYPRGFHIWLWRDLDADGRVDLVVSRGFCGAHTCFEDVQVLSFDGAGFANRLVGPTNELPFPTIRASDPEGDRLFRLEISTAGFGSVGAGPQRPETHIWGYDGAGWVYRETWADPSPYRIHILHDADDASGRADYDYAVAQYRRVIDDSELDDWSAGETGRADLAAYARFRIFAIAVALQDPAATAAALAELEANYPVGDARRVYVEMAILFRNAYNSGGLGAACTAAAGFAESQAGKILAPLGSGVYGYANRDYTGESMCPAPDVEEE